MSDELHYLYTDGASKGNPGPAGGGFVLTDSSGFIKTSRAIALGVTTVGVAEYRALIAGLTEARAQGVEQLHVLTDSQFMARQLQGIYKVRTPAIKPLYDQAKALQKQFRTFRIEHIGRELNNMADGLANEGARMSLQAPPPANGRRAKP